MLDVVVGVWNIVQSGCREVTDANEKLEVDEVGPDAAKEDRKRFETFGVAETVGTWIRSAKAHQRRRRWTRQCLLYCSFAESEAD
jgi:hypothetical protein